MHPDTQRDVDQKVNAGLITLMDAKIINKYLAEARIIRGLTSHCFSQIINS